LEGAEGPAVAFAEVDGGWGVSTSLSGRGCSEGAEGPAVAFAGVEVILRTMYGHKYVVHAQKKSNVDRRQKAEKKLTQSCIRHAHFDQVRTIFASPRDSDPAKN
jgi:hypothetical protein